MIYSTAMDESKRFLSYVSNNVIYRAEYPDKEEIPWSNFSLLPSSKIIANLNTESLKKN